MHEFDFAMTGFAADTCVSHNRVHVPVTLELQS